MRFGLLPGRGGLAMWLLMPLLLGWCGWVAAQTQAEPRFERLEDSAAIPDGVVSDVALDPSGMLWIGTSLGLVRYDGHSFTPIALVNRERRQAGTTFIRTLMAARDGRIWVGTDGEGLSVYDPRQEEWVSYLHDPKQPASLSPGVVRTIAEDKAGRIWLGSIGGDLQRLDPQTQRFERFAAAQGLPDPRVQHVSVDASGRVWVGTWNGVAVLPPGAKRLERPRLADGSELALAGQVVMAVAHMPDGSVWLGTQKGALWRLTRNGAALEQLDTAPSELGAVQAIAWVNERQVWIGRASGIERRDPVTGALRQSLRPSISKPWGLAGADIRSLIRDPANLVWVGGYGSGLQRVNNLDDAIWVRRPDADPSSVLVRSDVRSLLALRDGAIWVGTADGGIAVLDGALRTVAQIPAGQQGLGTGRVAALAQAPDGRVWVGSENQILVFTSAKAQGQTYALGPARVRRLLADRDGAIWVGTQDGLHRLAAQGQAFERVTHHDGRAMRGDVNALVQSADGTVWVGAEAGLFPVLPGAQVLAPIAFAEGGALANANVLGVLIDRSGQLWCDTTAGLHRLRSWDGRTAHMDYLGGKVAHATRSQAQSFGANLLEDARGRIWTQRGVYDPRDQQTHLLAAADGVDIGTSWFRSYTQLADGTMLFGGSRGMLVVQADAFRPTAFQPPVVPTALRVGSEDMPLAALQPTLTVPAAAGGFAIDFAALDLSDPARNRYRFRLIGRDVAWSESNRRQRQATYSGLAPGRYVLEVQGSNRNGDWSPKVYRQQVHVLPHWWQTWWGVLSVLLGLVAMGWLLVRLRTRSLLAGQVMLESRIAEATKALEDKSKALEESALTDPLTGLRNRRFIVERMEDDLRLVRRQFEEAQRRGESPPIDADLSFVMIDIDHFKRVNDTLGHAAGDAVLVHMRERLQEVFRESDYLVRWGGEEFLVVARGTSRESLPELAERARRAVAQRPFGLPNGQSLPMTCSIGFACFPLDRSQPRAEHWSEALALADAALYAAKREGRDRWVGVQTTQAATVSGLIEVLNAGQVDADTVVVRGPAR